MNDLKQIGLAYFAHLDTKRTAPTKAEDIAPFYENDARLTQHLKAGDYVFFWGVPPTAMKQGPSRTILAHERDVPTKGGVVLFGDGSVRQISAEDFKTAPKAGRPPTTPRNNRGRRSR